MAGKAGIGTVKVFDAKNGRGIIDPAEISKQQIGKKPVFFETSSKGRFRAGQLVHYVVDPEEAQLAKEVQLLSDSS